MASSRASSGTAARSPMVLTPSRRSRAAVAGPTPHSASTGLGCRKASSSPGATTTTPAPGRTPDRLAVGLAASEASLATSLDVATPTDADSPSSSADPPPDLGADRPARAEQPHRAGHVEEGLVQGDRLHHRRVRREDLVDPPAVLGVAVEAGRTRRRRGGTAGGPGPTAWPSGCRTPGPRSCRPPRPLAGPTRRRSAACPAGSGRAAPRPRRRRRPCRRGGWSPPRQARRPARHHTLTTVIDPGVSPSSR